MEVSARGRRVVSLGYRWSGAAVGGHNSNTCQLDPPSPALSVAEGACLSPFSQQAPTNGGCAAAGQEAAAPGSRVRLIASSSGRLRLLHSWPSLLCLWSQVTWQSHNLLIGLLQHGEEGRALLVARDMGLDDEALESASFPSSRA